MNRPRIRKSAFRASRSKSDRTALFSAESRGEIAILTFSRLAMEAAANLQHTETLWRYIDGLRKASNKVLLIEAEQGGLSPARVDAFWRSVRDSSSKQAVDCPNLTEPTSDLELCRQSNVFRHFVQVVRELNTFVIATFERDVDFTFLGPALACDYRIATQDAVFVNRFSELNVSPGMVSWFLAKYIGPSAATEMLLTNRVMTATDALKLGLVNRLVSPDVMHTDALGIAEEFAGKPRCFLMALKKCMVATSGNLSAFLDSVGTGFQATYACRYLNGTESG